MTEKMNDKVIFMLTMTRVEREELKRVAKLNKRTMNAELLLRAHLLDSDLPIEGVPTSQEIGFLPEREVDRLIEAVGEFTGLDPIDLMPLADTIKTSFENNPHLPDDYEAELEAENEVQYLETPSEDSSSELETFPYSPEEEQSSGEAPENAPTPKFVPRIGCLSLWPKGEKCDWCGNIH